jgi:hypothetical protein
MSWAIDLEALERAIISGSGIFIEMAARLNLTWVDSSLPTLPNA